MTNTAIKNAILEDSTNAINACMPTFETWYKSLDEFKRLEANSNGVLNYDKIIDAIASIEREVFNKTTMGLEIEDLEGLNSKHNELVKAKNFIEESQYVYNTISNTIDVIASHVSIGKFEDASKRLDELKNFNLSSISNPIADIDISAIKDEIRYAKRECAKLDAKNDAAHTAARSIAESCRDGFAVLGAVAAVAADLTLGVKVLKNLLK